MENGIILLLIIVIFVLVCTIGILGWLIQRLLAAKRRQNKELELLRETVTHLQVRNEECYRL